MTDHSEHLRQNFVPHDNLRGKYHLRFLLDGIKKAIRTKAAVPIALANILCAIVLLMLDIGGLFGGMLTFLWRTAGIAVLLIADAVTLLLLGSPKEYLKIMRRIERVPDFRNDDGESQILIERKVIDDKRNVEAWTFQSFGIGFDEWTKHMQQLENALDIAILSIGYGRDNTQTTLKVLQHPGPWPEVLRWDEQYLPEKESELCLGLNRSYPIVIDLARHPHYMIAAETGAGKSVLISDLIRQAIAKEYEVVLVDMKRFVDYHEMLSLLERTIDNKAEFSEYLAQLVAEMDRRMEILNASGAKNIYDYNHRFSGKMKRLLVVIDEYTEALDKGSTKEEKQQTEANEKNIARLCRLSRASGIHLIIGLQRGSAQEIDGQIRNNMRIVLGRCSDNLSLTMTGSTELGRMIPPDSVGMFVTDKRELFKAFYG